MKRVQENENLQICLTLFLLACPYIGPLSKNFDFNLRRDHKKKSYERHDYESVDEKSLSWAMFRKTIKKKKFRMKRVNVVECPVGTLANIFSLWRRAHLRLLLFIKEKSIFALDHVFVDCQYNEKDDSIFSQKNSKALVRVFDSLVGCYFLYPVVTSFNLIG